MLKHLIEERRMSLRWDTSESAGECRLRLVGDFDLALFGDVDRELQRLQTNVGRGIVVELDGLTFIDSNGPRALLLADEQAKLRGTELVLARPSQIVQKVLRLTALDEHFTFAEDAARASA